MEQLKIFVTGGTGFIGGHFLKNLLAQIGHDDVVYVLARQDLSFSDQRVVCLQGELANIDNFRNEILQCGYVFHLAANATFGDLADYAEINFEPTKKIVDILKENRVLKNFIFTSTVGAVDRANFDRCNSPLNDTSVPTPTSRYGKSKLKAEEYIQQSGILFTIIRPTWVYGPDMRVNSHINKFVSMALERNPIFKLAFPGKVSVIHVADLCQALVGCLNNKKIIGHKYFAVTESLSIGEIFKLIFEKINKKSLRQIKVPRFKFFFSRFHSKLPLVASNLFIDYLYVDAENFMRDFNIVSVKKISEGISDVIATNMHNAGYWVITGANSGIGQALAVKLHALKHRLILVDKNDDNLLKFNGQIILKRDLSSMETVISLAKEINHYKIFRLINNAGLGYKGEFVDLPIENLIRTIQVNDIAPILLAKLLLPKLIKNNGTLVNIASSAAFGPLPGMALYAASKSLILQWSHSLWYELRKKCLVITFSPSGTNSNFQNQAGVRSNPEGKGLLTSEYVAGRIIIAIKNKTPFVFLGFKNIVVIQFLKLLPVRFLIIFWGAAFKKLR